MAFNFFKRKNNDENKGINKPEGSEAQERRGFPFGSGITKPSVPTAADESPKVENAKPITEAAELTPPIKPENTQTAELKSESDNSAAPKTSSAPTSEPPQSTTIPTEALIRRGRKLFFDSTAMSAVGFVGFINSCSELFKTNKNSCFVPEFELALLPDELKQKLQALAENGVLTILKYDGVGNYKDFIAKIAVMGREKGQLCFIISQGANPAR